MRPALLLLLLCSCEPTKAVIDGNVGDTPATGDSAAGADTGEPGHDDPDPLEVALTGTAVFDPVLGDGASWTLTATEGATVSAVVTDGAGGVVRALADGAEAVDALSWDGRDEAGALVEAGTYTVVATAARGEEAPVEARAEVGLVRLGLSAGTLSGEDRVPLLWHRGGSGDGGGGRYYVQEDEEVTFALSALVDEAGAPVAVARPWDDLDRVPEDFADQNMPAAYPYDATPTLKLSFGGQVGGVPVTAEIEGWTAVSAQVTDGAELVFERATPLAEGPGVVEETLSVTFSADGQPVASVEVPLRIYALLGPPTFDSAESPYYPWVAVIDPALRDMAGVAPTEEAVTAALVDYIFNDLGLSYDTRYGASAYMSYGRGWDSARFNMSGFLSRSSGDVVNCSDCAGILTAHANMLGAYLGQSIIQPSFSLNYILAIGGDDFTHCPFGGSSCGFSYHAVTSPDGSDTIYDATLALDGDADPGSEPNEVLMVSDITGEEYLDRLVMSGSPNLYSYGTGELQ